MGEGAFPVEGDGGVNDRAAVVHTVVPIARFYGYTRSGLSEGVLEDRGRSRSDAHVEVLIWYRRVKRLEHRVILVLSEISTPLLIRQSREVIPPSVTRLGVDRRIRSKIVPQRRDAWVVSSRVNRRRSWY